MQTLTRLASRNPSPRANFTAAAHLRARHSLPILFFLTLFLWLPATGAVLAGDVAGADFIDIATPQWDGQTNADGSGLFFEIVKRVYSPEGIEMKFNFVPWKRAQLMVSDKQADAMLCVWREHAQEEGQRIPRWPLFVEYTAVVFKKDRISSWDGLKSLDGKSAVWLRGYDYHTFAHLKPVHFSRWTEVDDYARAWLLLKSEHYDVYIDALIDIEFYIAEQSMDMKPYRLEILWGENAYVAFAPTEKSDRLIRIFDRRILELAVSGELKAIYDKWGVRYPQDAWRP
ncbi:transporter substrate-binding domain-containing protein [uncultured Desulfosarcina sp.]|uniref:substrate-binding periplasmic protein n=1 Tax=uncultured Desulfosarcina sp. TaxID=218289 RepID=UPI0029C62B3D|nr:transporter substrate-binding domain-containing protein [uncultured Desulfosarcina sp.]